jgi:hypothetical protein
MRSSVTTVLSHFDGIADIGADELKEFPHQLPAGVDLEQKGVDISD